MTLILRPRESTLEFITMPSLKSEYVGLAGARQIIRGWILIANSRGESSARRHIERLMKALKTDILGVIAFHIRTSMQHCGCKELEAMSDPDDFGKTVAIDNTPLYIHEYARAAALTELYRAGLVVAPDRLRPFTNRINRGAADLWQFAPYQWPEVFHAGESSDVIAADESAFPNCARIDPAATKGLQLHLYGNPVAV